MKKTSSSITDFGAVEDGATINTRAIQAAIDHVASAAGGTVIIPAGTFLSGAIFLKPGVALQLDKDAVLKASTNIADYPLTNTRIEGHFQDWVPALVNAEKIDHLRITGNGTLDGSGKPFWEEFWRRYKADPKTKNLDVLRPRLLFASQCNDAQISGISLKDSAFWNLHVYNCDGVQIDGVTITAPASGPSTDGIDIDSSRNVNIRHCSISCGDDCIALKGSKGPDALADTASPPVEHIRISDCTFAEGEGLLTVGSEATTVRDVIVERCRITSAATAAMILLRLKLRPDTPQNYEDIRVSDITLAGNGRLISIQPWRQYFDLRGKPAPARSVRNLTLSNITGSFGAFGTIDPNPGDTIHHVLLENIDVQLKNPKPYVRGASDLVMKDMRINGKAYSGG